LLIFPARLKIAVMMSADLKTTAAQLQQDIDAVCTAFDACHDAIQRVRQHFPNERLQISSSIDFATWAYHRFEGDWNRFIAFTRESLDAWPREKSQMWVLGGPHEEESDQEAIRQLDRIDVALHLITQQLEMSLPFKTVRDHGWHQRKHLARVQAFVESLNDVLQPRSA
jgi:hypothetical protein